MVESAPRFALLRTGETTPDANTTECLGYGGGGNGRRRQLQQPEKLSKTEVGSPARIRTTIHGSKGRRQSFSLWPLAYSFAAQFAAAERSVCRRRATVCRSL